MDPLAGDRFKSDIPCIPTFGGNGIDGCQRQQPLIMQLALGKVVTVGDCIKEYNDVGLDRHGTPLDVISLVNHICCTMSFLICVRITSPCFTNSYFYKILRFRIFCK